MIIVEGPDGSGKTTLVQQIAKRFNRQISPRIVDKDTHAMVDVIDWVENNLRRKPDYMVYDRYALISEFIYAPLLRGAVTPGYDRPEWLLNRMTQLYQHKRPLIIYCLPPIETVMANVASDEDNQVIFDSDKIVAIYQLYLAKMTADFATYHAWWYDYTRTGPRERILDQLAIVLESGNH